MRHRDDERVAARRDDAARADEPHRPEARRPPVAGEARHGHRDTERRDRHGCGSAASSEVVARVDRAPVRGGPLADEGGEADRAQGEHARQRQVRPVGGSRRLVGLRQLPCEQRRAREREHGRDDGELPGGRHADRGRQRAHRAAGEERDAPDAVQPGQDRPAVRPLHGDPLDVEGDVEQAAERAERHQARAEPRIRRSDRGPDEGEAEDHRPHADDVAAAHAPHRERGQARPDHRRNRHHEQRQPDAAVADPEPVLERRQPRREASPDRGVDGEGRRDADARPAQSQRYSRPVKRSSLSSACVASTRRTVPERERITIESVTAPPGR